MHFGSAFGMAGGIGALGRSMSTATESQNHTSYSLIIFFSKKVYETRRAYNLEKSWLGRVFNKCTGIAPYYVLLSGHHLVQCMHVLHEISSDKDIPPDAKCGIRIDVAQKVLKELEKNYRAKTT